MMIKRVVIVDIDGTIANNGDRIKHLQKAPKDWDSYFDACDKDEPIESIIDLVRSLSGIGYDICFCTGRTELTREKTVKWLNVYCWGIDWNSLLMRKTNDYRHDIEVKPELLKEARIDFNHILFVLEDRNSMVAKWRELGLTCLQVAEGDF